MKNFNNYLESKGISQEDFAKLGAEEQAQHFNDHNEAQRKAIAEALEAKANKEDIDAMKDELRNSMTEQMKSLNQALKDQGVAIKKLSESEKAEKAATFGESLKAGLSENIEGLKKLKHSKSASVTLDVKQVDTMTSANISGGNVPVEDRIPGLNLIASRQPRLLDFFTRSTTESNVVSWVYQANRDGGAGQTAEGTIKSQADFDLVVNSESIKKTTSYIKVSTEMLDDIEWMRSEIDNELIGLLLRQVEFQAIDGSGAGTDLNGVNNIATAFNPTAAFAQGVDNATNVDVLVAAFDQIEAAEHEMIRPAVFMNPQDVNILMTKKALSTATDTRYNEYLTTVGSTLVLMGRIPIIKSTLIGQGTYLVGDFAKAYLVEKDGLKIDIGLDGSDWTNNLRTIIAEWRGLVYVKDNDRTAFVSGGFAASKAALETT